MSRQRYVYRANPETGDVEAIRVDADYQRHEERQPVFTDRHLEGMRAPDGSDIGCRWKRDEWMKRTGAADASDYAKSWKQAQEKRADWLQGRSPVSREMAETVGRTAYELSKRGKR